MCSPSSSCRASRPWIATATVWTQHLALQVDTMEELLAAKARLQADGIEVIGPTDHTLFQSIYFFDPSGHRLELAVNTGTPEMLQSSTK
jgi:lactoylglutathione lyase